MTTALCLSSSRLRINATINRRIPSRGPCRRVSELFGLARKGNNTSTHRQKLYEDFHLTFRPGEITTVVGPSGAGKSVLLDLAQDRLEGAIRLDVERIRRSKTPPVAMLRGESLSRRLEILSRCGLAEATALITPAKLLSGGQQYRLALAVAFDRALARNRMTVIIADEFASTLDVLTAGNLCRQIRKLVSGTKVSLLLATPRVELLDALASDKVVVKPLAGRPKVMRDFSERQGRLDDMCHADSNPADWPVERGTIADYRHLSQFHYLGGPPAVHKRVYVIRPPQGSRGIGALLEPSPAGVLVVSPPLRCVAGRNLATSGRYSGNLGRALPLLNAEMECISRVIIHPSYRGLGLAVRLVRHALSEGQKPYMEALAVMGHIHPFFERAGMSAWKLPRRSGKKYMYYLAKTSKGNAV